MAAACAERMGCTGEVACPFMVVLLDTNIVLEHLNSGALRRVAPEIFFVVSVITVAEALRLPGLDEESIVTIERFLSITEIQPVDLAIAKRAASLGRTRTTKLPDLLIAATALELGIPLITKNIRDFRGIPGLEVREIV